MGYWAKDGSYVREEGDQISVEKDLGELDKETYVSSSGVENMSSEQLKGLGEAYKDPGEIDKATYVSSNGVENMSSEQIEGLGRAYKDPGEIDKKTYVSSNGIDNLSLDQHDYLFRQGVKAEEDRKPYEEMLNDLIKNGSKYDQETFDAIVHKLSTDSVLFSNFLEEFKNNINQREDNLLENDLTKEEAQKECDKLGHSLDDFTRIISGMNDIGHPFTEDEIGELKGVFHDNDDFEAVDFDSKYYDIRDKYGITIKAKIPHDLGEEFGEGFMVRDGYANNVMDALIDEVDGKEVYWERENILVYKDGEMTPSQRMEDFNRRQQEKMQQELVEMLTPADENEISMDNSRSL